VDRVPRRPVNKQKPTLCGSVSLLAPHCPSDQIRSVDQPPISALMRNRSACSVLLTEWSLKHPEVFPYHPATMRTRLRRNANDNLIREKLVNPPKTRIIWISAAPFSTSSIYPDQSHLACELLKTIIRDNNLSSSVRRGRRDVFVKPAL